MKQKRPLANRGRKYTQLTEIRKNKSVANQYKATPVTALPIWLIMFIIAPIAKAEIEC
jgi:hypothetical protein